MLTFTVVWFSASLKTAQDVCLLISYFLKAVNLKLRDEKAAEVTPLSPSLCLSLPPEPHQCSTAPSLISPPTLPSLPLRYPSIHPPPWALIENREHMHNSAFYRAVVAVPQLWCHPQLKTSTNTVENRWSISGRLINFHKLLCSFIALESFQIQTWVIQSQNSCKSGLRH